MTLVLIAATFASGCESVDSPREACADILRIDGTLPSIGIERATTTLACSDECAVHPTATVSQSSLDIYLRNRENCEVLTTECEQPVVRCR